MALWGLLLLVWWCGSIPPLEADEGSQTNPPLGISDEGGTVNRPVYQLDCVGAGITCSFSGTTGTLTVGGGGSNHNFLSATHTDTVAASPTRGDLVVANSTPSWARFGIGGSNTVLTSNGTDPAWLASPTVTNLTATNTVTGAAVAMTSVICTGTNKLTTDANGNLLCAADQGTGTVTSISQGTNMSFSVNPITSTGTINLVASPSVTNLTASGTTTGSVVDISGQAHIGSLTANQYVKTNSGSVLVSQSTPIPLADGGTGVSSAADDTILVSNGTIFQTKTVPDCTDTSGNHLNYTQASNTVSCGTSVATHTHTINIAGDTGNDTLTVGGGTETFSGGTGISTSESADTVTINLVTPVTVPHGGTGQTSFTSNGVIYGNSTSALNVTSQGGSNTVLTANAGAPAFSSTPTVVSLNATDNVTGVNIKATGTVTGVNLAITSLNCGTAGVTVDSSGNAICAGNSVRDRPFSSFCAGTLSTTMNCTAVRPYVPYKCTIQGIFMTVGTAPSGSSVIVNPLECSSTNPNSCTPFLASANRPSIAAGAVSSSTTTTGIVISSGEYLGWNIDQIGSGTAGSNLTITTVCRF